MLIADAQSVKNTDTAENKGFDGGKLVSGIKRHIAVDTNGLPHAILVTTANISDKTAAVAMFKANQARLTRVKKVLVDGGYIGEPFAAAVFDLLGAEVEVANLHVSPTYQ